MAQWEGDDEQQLEEMEILRQELAEKDSRLKEMEIMHELQDVQTSTPQRSCKLTPREILPRTTFPEGKAPLIAIDFDECLCPYQANFFRWFAETYPGQPAPDSCVLFDS